ncbi:MAG: 50S ribosomal protein L34 [Parcubacteria group bacterium]
MSTTYKPKKRKRAKTHGFLTRQKTSGGRRTIQSRRRKGRTKLSASRPAK